jgi:hypothetical protein
MPNDLIQYLVEGTEIQEGTVGKFFTGIDQDEFKKLKDAASATSITKADKEKLIDQIDDAIDNSNRVLTPPTFLHFLGTVIPYAGLASAITRAIKSNDRKEYRHSLNQLRMIAVAIKVKD